jgi:hypothetical protein
MGTYSSLTKYSIVSTRVNQDVDKISTGHFHTLVLRNGSAYFTGRNFVFVFNLNLVW